MTEGTNFDNSVPLFALLSIEGVSDFLKDSLVSPPQQEMGNLPLLPWPQHWMKGETQRHQSEGRRRRREVKKRLYSLFHVRWPQYWSFSFISPSNEYSGLVSFRIDWFDLLEAQGTLKSILQ